MQKPSSIIKEKIAQYKKNHLDISDLIQDIDISGMDLSYAYIKYLKRNDTDISNCNFTYTELGDATTPYSFSLIRCKMNNCNFEGAKFLGQAWIRSCDAQSCNFKEADVTKVSYENTNFLGSTFCGACIKISTRAGIGCKFPVEMFQQLTENWKLKLTAEYKE